MGEITGGANVANVAVPVTGRLLVAPAGTALPSPVEGAKKQLVITGAQELGLLTDDGGMEWALTGEGDAIEFFQSGYSLPSGLSKAELSVTLAQTDKVTQELLRGVKYDKDGFALIDAAGNQSPFMIIAEEIFANGTVRRRIAPNVSIGEVKETRAKRGEVTAYEVTLKISKSPGLENKHFGEWLLPTGFSDTVSPAGA